MHGRVRYFARLTKHVVLDFSRAPPYRTFVLGPKHHFFISSFETVRPWQYINETTAWVVSLSLKPPCRNETQLLCPPRSRSAILSQAHPSVPESNRRQDQSPGPSSSRGSPHPDRLLGANHPSREPWRKCRARAIGRGTTRAVSDLPLQSLISAGACVLIWDYSLKTYLCCHCQRTTCKYET